MRRTGIRILWLCVRGSDRVFFRTASATFFEFLSIEQYTEPFHKLDRLDAEGLVITKHGKPVAKLISIDQRSADLIGKLKGKIKIKGDILSTGTKWNAQS